MGKTRGRQLFEECVKRVERLESSLTRRYQFRQEGEQIEDVETVSPDPAKAEKEEFADRKDISPQELHGLINRKDRPQVLVLDARSNPRSVMKIPFENFTCVSL